MPTISAKQINTFTSEISIKLKSDDPSQLVEALLKFGEFLGEKFPDKTNEEIQKELNKSGIAFDSHVLSELALVKLGAMNGIATAYYSERDDKSDDMLAEGDNSLLRTYKAWKIATVVFAYFVGENSKGDLFAGLQTQVKEKTAAWTPQIHSQVDKIVEEESSKKQTINKLQDICKQYQELIANEIKQATLELPRHILASLKDQKGKIDIEKVLGMSDLNVHKYPALHTVRTQYLAIQTLNNSLNNQSKTFSARINHFCTLIKDPIITEMLTSNSVKKSLWDSLMSIIRAVRISGTAGFFHADNKRQADTKLNNVIASLPKAKL